MTDIEKISDIRSSFNSEAEWENYVLSIMDDVGKIVRDGFEKKYFPSNYRQKMKIYDPVI